MTSAASIRLRPRALLAAVAAVVALAAALMAAAPDRAHAARGMEIALQDDAVFQSQSYFDRERAFRYLRRLGVTRLRTNVIWAYTMPRSQYNARRKPKAINWNFDAVDSLIDAAAKHGIRVHVSLTGPAPRWATAGRRKVGVLRPDPRHYGQFVRVAAEHFDGRVDRYSIWNEPNWKTWLSPRRRAAKIYRNLYRRGYRAIKSVDRRAQVLIGETSPYGNRRFAIHPIKFLRGVACVNDSYRRVGRCKTLKADGYAHHPYDFRHAPAFRYPGADNATIGTLSNLTRALDRLQARGALRPTRGKRMPVYLTEYGYFASGRRALAPRKRSRYLAQGFGIALRNPRVKSMLQYLLVAPPGRSSSAFFNLSLISQRGKPFPQYRALRRWYRANRRKVRRPSRQMNLPPAPPNPVSP